MAIQVNAQRLQDDLEKLSTFGREADGSVSRPAFSDADLSARRWFAERARAAGLSAHVDDVQNVLFRDDRCTAQRPAVWTGSHLDSVPSGGMFDGALGSVAALECLRRLREEDIPLARPVQGVAFSDEEGSYLGFAGSKSLTGALGEIDLQAVHGADGRTLAEAITASEGGIGGACGPGLPEQEIAEFLELHIEQGPILETEGIDIGAVTGIVGVVNASVRFSGRPDHAGTTPMNLRRDAMRGAAAFLDRLSSAPPRAGRPDSVVTCGRVEVHPGADNVVPESVTTYLDFRDPTQEGMDRLEATLRALSEGCARDHDLDVVFTVDSATRPTATDEALTDVIIRQAQRHGLTVRRMPSGAGHDSQVMATRVPIGMIFVPSRGGRSHSRLESTAWDDVIGGANVLLSTLVERASRSD